MTGWLTAMASDLTLTGLARHRGQTFAYLTSGKSSESFSLKLGQELANLKLDSVDFKKGEAVVVAGDERLVLALERRSKETVTVEATPALPHPPYGAIAPNRSHNGNGQGRMPPNFPVPHALPQPPMATQGSNAVPDAPPTDNAQNAPGAPADANALVHRAVVPAVVPIPIAIQTQGVTSPDDPLPEPTDH